MLACEDLFRDLIMKKNVLRNLMTLASNINFVSKKLMGKYLYGENNIQLI
jgi:hypothetical protein